jgi:hypothetical protein
LPNFFIQLIDSTSTNQKEEITTAPTDAPREATKSYVAIVKSNPLYSEGIPTVFFHISRFFCQSHFAFLLMIFYQTISSLIQLLKYFTGETL